MEGFKAKSGGVARLLQDCKLVVQVASPGENSSPRFIPSLPLDRITVKEVLDCLRQARGQALALALDEGPNLGACLNALLENAPSPQQSQSLEELINQWFKEGETPQN